MIIQNQGSTGCLMDPVNFPNEGSEHADCGVLVSLLLLILRVPKHAPVHERVRDRVPRIPQWPRSSTTLIR